VGWSFNGGAFAAEWKGDAYTNLGGLHDFSSFAQGINDSGQVVGYSVGEDFSATEWDGGSIVDLGSLPGSASAIAWGINIAGQAVGWSFGVAPPPAPEPSTWAMMLIGFAGLGFAGYRRAKAGGAV
jgi:probable HAF family extracellular repeat protein